MSEPLLRAESPFNVATKIDRLEEEGYPDAWIYELSDRERFLRELFS